MDWPDMLVAKAESMSKQQFQCLILFSSILLINFRLTLLLRMLWQDMAWCQEYAMQNRQAMRKLMEDAVEEVTGAQPDHSRAVNIHHNFWCGGVEC